MSFLTGGQDFVVAGNNRSRGMGGLASLGRLASHLAVQKHLISHRADEQIRVQGAGHESRAKWGAVSQAMSNKMTREDVLGFHDDVFKRFDDEHPDVKSGKIKKQEDGNYPYLRPELAEQVRRAGQAESRKGGQIPGPVAGITRSEIVAENNPPKTPSAPKPPKTPKPKFDPNNPNNGFKGYTPRKTGTGGYDEALKSGAIDQETYDSYLEDSKKPGKDYMPKQASTAIDTLVKERDSRKETFDTGTNEHRINVSNAWGDGKITTEEASDLSTPGSDDQKLYNESKFEYYDSDEGIQNTHANAGLDDKKGTKY